jgi:hypothetical protein
MSFYKENIPNIIERCKEALTQCLEIIDRPIDGDLSDDKLHNALKGKRMAAEDAKWYAREVDNLQNELLDKSNEEETGKPGSAVNRFRRNDA